MQAIFAQQQKLLKVMQEKPEMLDDINAFVKLLKENGACLRVWLRVCAPVTKRAGAHEVARVVGMTSSAPTERRAVDTGSLTCVFRIYAGVDVTSGQMPSKMDMFRVLMKSEVRESAMKVMSALTEAGIDVQSKVSLTRLRWLSFGLLTGVAIGRR